MDGRALQKRFPRVQVDEDAIYVQDDRVWTSAGISAGIDLALAVSSRTLHRQLLKETGLPPAAWLKRLRIESACRSLANHQLSLKQIAHRSGFGDEYNMRRAFNLELGITPSEYRKRLCA